MHDILIRNGTIVDGTGNRPFHGDVAIAEGIVRAVGPSLNERARETVDAEGRLVTPGFVDIHTHYDGQASWDDEIRPSFDHGATTVVMGNCGVGFAPVKPGTEDWLIQLMEGVEDIPGTALSEGIDWQWETFPQYLDALARHEYSLDLAAQIPHGALRFYVMGERGANDGPASETDVETMAQCVQEALQAGAVGFTSSRIMAHQSVDGRPVPGTHASEEELIGIARAMRRARRGVFELIPAGIIGETAGLPSDRLTPEREMIWMRKFAETSGRPVTFTMPPSHPKLLDAQDAAVAEGIPLHGQFGVRPAGVLTSLQGYHAFTARPTYKKLARLPLAARVAEMRKPDVRSAILGETDVPVSTAAISENFHLMLQDLLDCTYRLQEPVDYEPEPSNSVSAIAKARGVDPLRLLYDLLLEEDGEAVLIGLFGYQSTNDHSQIEKLLGNQNAVVGLGDGGAHAKLICDASSTTYLLSHWGRDRTRGRTFPIEYLVRKQTSDNARLYGLTDRGVVATGKRADLNIIDFYGLQIGKPRIVRDLPGGEGRYLQTSTGYDHTLVNGVFTRRNGVDTGLRPGRLARSRSD